MKAADVDYTLYLVTDSTPDITKGRDVVDIVKQACEGGVTIVQYREKTNDKAHLIQTARKLHTVTQQYGVPLLINDHVDVAVEVGAEGVHIGQDDMLLNDARARLGPDAIIGVTANSEDEALEAASGGADYLGLGTVFATATKKDTKSIIGPVGVQHILGTLSSKGFQAVKTVCIGGVNASNAQRVLFQSTLPSKSLDGIAVVSAIMSADDVKSATIDLRKLISTPPAFARRQSPQSLSVDTVLTSVPQIVARLAAAKSLCHNMTNLVVQNFAANVALAVGASPIMSNDGREAADLAALNGSLVINMGTSTPEAQLQMLMAIAAYNDFGGPVLLDPVGAGATQVRQAGVKTLMAGGYFHVIKGNEGEIQQVSGALEVKQHGVDSGASKLSLEERIVLVKRLAARERNVILMTGSTDVVSDGQRTFLVSNGHEYLGEITGSGCTLGTTIASMLAVSREDPLLGALAGLLLYEIAAERAAREQSVHGPGTFVPTFIDQLFQLRQASVRGDGSWAQAAKLKSV